MAVIQAFPKNLCHLLKVLGVKKILSVTKRVGLLAKKSIEYSKLSEKDLFCVSFETKNWGDWLNKWLIEKITGKKVVVAHINHLNICKFLGLLKSERPVFTAIGSIMHYVPDDAFVWGTGCVYHTMTAQIKPSKILSVRGPLSARVMKDNGFGKSFLYGDPALLISKFLHEFPDERKNYAVGVIPHHSECLYPAVRQLSKLDDVLIIDIESSQEKLVSDIKKCDYIFSSSLHGLILSDVLRVPNKWVRFRADFPGDGFKFNDYYASLCGLERHKETHPILVDVEDVGSGILKKIKLQSTVHESNIDLADVEGVFIDHLKTKGWL